jgi:uncharacterized protein (DUF3820 family)
MKEHIRMGFGRYKGLPVDQVPVEYARWLMSQPNPPKGWLAEDLQVRAEGKVPPIRKWVPKPPDEVLSGATEITSPPEGSSNPAP